MLKLKNHYPPLTGAKRDTFAVLQQQAVDTVAPRLQTSLLFKRTQGAKARERDKELLKNIAEYLNCGSIRKYSSCIDYTRSALEKFGDLALKIIPFFDKYNIIGIKKKDYQDFKKVVELMNNKEHLSRARATAGLEKIFKIKKGMNKGR